MAISIEIFRPFFDQEEIKAVTEALESKWWGLGPRTEKFEKSFANKIGSKFAVGVNSCTSALELSIRSLMLPSDTVFIVPAISFIATAFAPIYAGHRVVFADVEPDTLMLSGNMVKEAIAYYGIGNHAIIHVDLYGNMVDIKKEYEDEVVIEDCAHAAGSSLNGIMAGTQGVPGCFSFHSVKNLACADGGMITTDDEKIYKKLNLMRWFGINKSTYDRSKENSLRVNYGWEYDITEFGYKMHMNDLTASLGLAQLAKLDRGNELRRNIASVYRKELSDQRWIEFMPEIIGMKTSQHIFAIKTKLRNDLNLFLKDKGIATGVHYKPMYKYSIMREHINVSQAEAFCVNTENEWEKLLSLPCYPTLTELEQEYIIAKIKEFGVKHA